MEYAHRTLTLLIGNTCVIQATSVLTVLTYAAIRYTHPMEKRVVDHTCASFHASSRGKKFICPVGKYKTSFQKNALAIIFAPVASVRVPITT